MTRFDFYFSPLDSLRSALLLLLTAFLLSCADTDKGRDLSSSDSATADSRQDAQWPDAGTLPGNEYQVILDTISEKNEKPDYEVRTVYPQIRGLKNREIEERFNRGLRDSVTAMIRDFESSIVPEEELGEIEGMESTSTFELESIIHSKAEGLLSIELAAYAYNAGAAHPNSFAVSFNYDLQAGRFLSLEDLFLPDAEYLKTIADYCIDELKRRDISDEEWIGRGAEQKIENYQTFFITPAALVIHFDPYQVAPYAAGPQRVEIPWSRLRGVVSEKVRS